MPSVAGEWVDVAKSTPTDTMVWALTPGGDDELIHVAVRPSGVTTERRHFGRWSMASASADTTAAICFVRRPGRDAPSCIQFAIDTIRTGDRTRRRLRLRNYVGEHHTGDRELLERLPRAEVSSGAAPAASGAESGGSGGGFQANAVQPERPSVATHAGTVAPGFAEVESGFERDRNSDGSSAGSVPTLLKLGLTRRSQLAVQLPLLGGAGTPSGLGDIAFGLKWRLTEDDPRLQDIAVLPQLKLSTGGSRGSGTTDASLLLINSRTVGPIGVDINVGVTRRSGDGTTSPRTATLWAIAAGIPVHGPLGWALESFGYPGTGGEAGAAPSVALLTGPTLVIRPQLEWDVGVIIPLRGDLPHGIYSGFVTNLGRVFPAW